MNAMDEEQAAAALLREQALAECAEWNRWREATKDERAAISERARAWQEPQPVETPAPRTRAVEPRQKTQPQRAGVDWDAVSKWVYSHIDQSVGKKTREYVIAALEGLAQEAAKHLDELQVNINRQAEKITALEARLDAEIRAAQDARIAVLEQRLAEVELRGATKPPRPQLVIGGPPDAS